MTRRSLALFQLLAPALACRQFCANLRQGRLGYVQGVTGVRHRTGRIARFVARTGNTYAVPTTGFGGKRHVRLGWINTEADAMSSLDLAASGHPALEPQARHADQA